MLGLASLELAVAFWLCLAAAGGCVAYGWAKWDDRGPLSEELRDLARWAPSPPSGQETLRSTPEPRAGRRLSSPKLLP
ncbi:MAG: hypothetical protein KQJ78_05060 [Deltaproteobacteria bacterium]|nr:hypothetical protein [Deltaproteobacteria bacterium]